MDLGLHLGGRAAGALAHGERVVAVLDTVDPGPGPQALEHGRQQIRHARRHPASPGRRAWGPRCSADVCRARSRASSEGAGGSPGRRGPRRARPRPRPAKRSVLPSTGRRAPAGSLPGLAARGRPRPGPRPRAPGPVGQPRVRPRCRGSCRGRRRRPESARASARATRNGCSALLPAPCPRTTAVRPSPRQEALTEPSPTGTRISAMTSQGPRIRRFGPGRGRR